MSKRSHQPKPTEHLSIKEPAKPGHYKEKHALLLMFQKGDIADVLEELEKLTAPLENSGFPLRASKFQKPMHIARLGTRAKTSRKSMTLLTR